RQPLLHTSSASSFAACPLSSYVSVSLFSFSCSAYRRALPSFPTRRSSDLPGRRGRLQELPLIQTDLCRRGTAPAGFFVETRRTRSEEHTSELQSRFDLVCRLLLEKKKIAVKPTNFT